MKISKIRKEFRTVVMPALKAYGKALQDAADRSVIRKGKQKGRYFVYNAAPGHLDLATGDFIQYGKPKWKKVKVW